MESNAVDHKPQIDSPTIINPLDAEEFKRQGYMMIDFLADYYRNVANYPVLSQVEPNYLRKCLPESAPFDPQPIEAILQDVRQHIIPGTTDWRSPNFFAYFQATASTAGFLGEMLSTGLNVVEFNWVASAAATELESIVMDRLGQELKLPETFLFSGNGGGVLLNTICEAILCTLVAARDKVFSHIGKDKITKFDKVGRVFVIRCAIGTTFTEQQHVIMAWKVVQEKANLVLGQPQGDLHLTRA